MERFNLRRLISDTPILSATYEKGATFRGLRFGASVGMLWFLCSLEGGVLGAKRQSRDGDTLRMFSDRMKVMVCATSCSSPYNVRVSNQRIDQCRPTKWGFVVRS